MTPEEVKKAFEDLKSEGMDEDAILVALGKMFQNGDVTKEQLEALIHQLGYEFTEEFAGKSDEESKDSVLGESESESDGSDEDEPGESESESDGSDEDEGEEREYAKKHLFGLD